MRYALYIIVALLVTVWTINTARDKYYQSERPPFWEGTEMMQVCKIPYFSSNDCNKFLVTLIDEDRAQIQLESGQYMTTGDLTCYFAANFIEDQPRYVFCRSWDSKGQQWDLMPSWAYYPSTEDMMLELEEFDYR